MTDSFPPVENWVLKEVAVPTTSGNVVRNTTCPAGFRWKVVGGSINYVADANASDRYFGLSARNVSGDLLTEYPENATAITAGQTRRIAMMPEVSHLGGQLLAGIDVLLLGLGDLFIEDTDLLRIIITGGLAGDQYSGRFLVLEIKL